MARFFRGVPFSELGVILISASNSGTENASTMSTMRSNSMANSAHLSLEPSWMGDGMNSWRKTDGLQESVRRGSPSIRCIGNRSSSGQQRRARSNAAALNSS